MFIQKIDIRISSDILPKWNDIRTSHIPLKLEGYMNQFVYNSLSEIAVLADGLYDRFLSTMIMEVSL